MTFSKVPAQYLTLKKRLAVHVGPNVLPEITIDLPKGIKDELSFMRLVMWGYVLIYETGRVPLNYLKELPPLSEFGKILPHVRWLRTWSSHNLHLDKNSDIKTMASAITWFKRTCGTGTPTTAEHWRMCFEQLCNDLVDLLEKAVDACDHLGSEEDGPRLIDDLKKRIDRQWEAYRFDHVVEESMIRLGYTGMDVVTFRGKYLDKWRKVVAVASDGDIDHLLALRIEADLLVEMSNALPITSQEMLKQLHLEEGDELAAAMLLIKAQRERGLNLPAILNQVFEKLNSQQEGKS